jgi:hypothetical protein
MVPLAVTARRLPRPRRRHQLQKYQEVPGRLCPAYARSCPGCSTCRPPLRTSEGSRLGRSGTCWRPASSGESQYRYPVVGDCAACSSTVRIWIASSRRRSSDERRRPEGGWDAPRQGFLRSAAKSPRGPEPRSPRLTLARRQIAPLPHARAERSAVVGSQQPVCAACGGPRDPRRREACSDRCRVALSRKRRAEALAKRDRELRALLEEALRKLEEGPL